MMIKDFIRKLLNKKLPVIEQPVKNNPIQPQYKNIFYKSDNWIIAKTDKEHRFVLYDKNENIEYIFDCNHFQKDGHIVYEKDGLLKTTQEIQNVFSKYIIENDLVDYTNILLIKKTDLTKELFSKIFNESKYKFLTKICSQLSFEVPEDWILFIIKNVKDKYKIFSTIFNFPVGFFKFTDKIINEMIKELDESQIASILDYLFIDFKKYQLFYKEINFKYKNISLSNKIKKILSEKYLEHCKKWLWDSDYEEWGFIYILHKLGKDNIQQFLKENDDKLTSEQKELVKNVASKRLTSRMIIKHIKEVEDKRNEEYQKKHLQEKQSEINKEESKKVDDDILEKIIKYIQKNYKEVSCINNGNKQEITCKDLSIIKNERDEKNPVIIVFHGIKLYGYGIDTFDNILQQMGDFLKIKLNEELEVK